MLPHLCLFCGRTDLSTGNIFDTNIMTGASDDPLQDRKSVIIDIACLKFVMYFRFGLTALFLVGYLKCCFKHAVVSWKTVMHFLQVETNCLWFYGFNSKANTTSKLMGSLSMGCHFQEQFGTISKNEYFDRVSTNIFNVDIGCRRQCWTDFCGR